MYSYMYFHRPQGKVIFLQTSVCPQGGRVSLVPGTFRRGRVSLVPCPFCGVGYLGTGYPGGWVSRGKVYHTCTPSPAVEVTAAVGTYPTGMLSCCHVILQSFAATVHG